MRIKRLPPHIVSRIAAGEVVERPASVVKELIENAIDAGATRISVSLGDGGRSLVEVWDDGCGMTEEEALVAVERHTTSKVSSERDLEAISTLGFRGEALYAISSVSMFTLITRTASDDTATRLRIHGGLLKGVDKVYRDTQGTTVTVENLFFNLRARRRFLKSKRIEQEHVRRVFKEYSVAYPSISFSYAEDGEPLWSLSPAPLEERIADVLRGSVLGESESSLARLILVDNGEGELMLFVNGRAVQDRGLAYLVRGALKQRFSSDSIPTAVLFLEIDPKDVDVNVHPTKREVRFRDRQRVYSAVEDVLGKACRRSYSYAPDSYTPSVAERVDVSYMSSQQASLQGLDTSLRYRFLGEAFGVYMLFEDAEENQLLIVDKHALHERLIYDSVIEGTSASVKVFIPLDEEMLSYRDVLERIGFEVEEGAITAVPKWAYGSEMRIVRNILSELEAEAAASPSHVEVARIACRAAVKAGDVLRPPDADYVARLLERLGEDLTCPHGRPVVVKLKKGEIDSLFKRRL